MNIRERGRQIFNSVFGSNVTPAPEVRPAVKLSDIAQKSLEVGKTGVSFFRGYINDPGEFNTNMRGLSGIETYEKMRRTDAQVAALLYVLKLPLRSAKWTIRCEDEKRKEFLTEALVTRISWSDALSHALLCLDFGFELMEKVYVEDAGKIWLKKLAHRAQTTINTWDVNKETGDLEAIKQRAYDYAGVMQDFMIPADKTVLFAFQKEGNNFEGISVLRPCYKHWYFKDEIYRIDAIAHERFGVGVPVWTLAEGWTDDDLDAAETICEQYKAGERSKIVKPPGHEFEIAGAGEGTRYDPMPTIHHHDEMITRSALAQFLNFGTTQTGSRALGDSAIGLFLDSERALGKMIADTFTKGVLNSLEAINFPGKPMAFLECTGINKNSVEVVTNAASRLGLAGFLTPGDEDTETHFRDVLEMPQRESKGKVSGREPHSHRHSVRLDETGGDFWRPLRECETFVSLREIDGRQDDARDQIRGAVNHVKTEWADDLKKQIANALSDGDPSDVGAIAIPDDLKVTLQKETVAIFKELYVYGKRTVEEELNRQRRKAKMSEVRLRDSAIESEEVKQLWWTRSGQFLNRLSSRVENEARDRALSLWRTKHSDYTQTELDFIANEVVAIADTTARLEAPTLVSEAFDMGRAAEAEAQSDEIDYAEYSAILDENLCDECEPFDGEEFDLGTPEYYDAAPPNKKCLGRDRCRCIFVYVIKGEQEAST